jgi:monoamine oxidase
LPRVYLLSVVRREAWTRREFLQTGALAGFGALALAACRDVSRVGRPDGQNEVVIVGAGLAGLVAARTLAADDWQVVVVEARDRVGGRVLTARFPDDQTGELGGEFIDRDHEAILELIDDLGLKLERIPPGPGEDLVRRGRVTEAWDAYLDADGGEARDDRARFYEALADLARDVDPADPPAAPNATELDNTSVATFLDELALSPRGRFFVERVDIIDEYTVAPTDLSLLQVVGDSARTTGLGNGDYEVWRVKGGNGQIARRIARDLDGTVEFGRPVRSVEQDDESVRLVAGNRPRVGRYAIIATPLPPLRAVRFDPALPRPLAGAVAELGYGTGTKTLLGYDRRVWRDEGYSGYAVTDLAVGTTWEATDGQPGSRGVLLGYTVGPAGVTLGDESGVDRVATVTADADVLFPGSADAQLAGESIAWQDEPYTGGTYTAFKPGQVTAFWRAIREPFGRVHWAGEHTDTYTAYMEGAVRSGLRVAKEINARG